MLRIAFQSFENRIQILRSCVNGRFEHFLLSYFTMACILLILHQTWLVSLNLVILTQRK